MVRVKNDLINDEVLSKKFTHYLAKEVELKCKANSSKWKVCADIANTKFHIKKKEEANR